MDIEYVDTNYLGSMKPVDTSLDEKEAEKLTEKNIRHRERVKAVRFEIKRLTPPRQAKCPNDLTSITL